MSTSVNYGSSGASSGVVGNGTSGRADEEQPLLRKPPPQSSGRQSSQGHGRGGFAVLG